MSISAAVIYACFYATIGFSCWVLESGWPLVAMIFTPQINEGSNSGGDV